MDVYKRIIDVKGLLRMNVKMFEVRRPLGLGAYMRKFYVNGCPRCSMFDMKTPLGLDVSFAFFAEHRPVASPALCPS